MGAPAITPRVWERYEHLRQRGWKVTPAAREVGISAASAWKREKARNSVTPTQRPTIKEALVQLGPIPVGDLSEDAKRALEDFGFFQQRYFGRIATPWQAEAALQVKEYLESPVKEFVVVNCPPGAGKSTLFTLDIPAWLTCRNRAIRGQIGSKTNSSAKQYVRRLRRALERTLPIKAEEQDVARGLALDAVACLGDDFGSFKVEGRELWAAEAFVVAQHGGHLIDEKEPTWSAFGMDTGFLGMRYDFIIWDDLVDTLVLRTAESRENQQSWWDDVAEKRLEPAGLLVLQGQRMGADDLYRYCLDKRVIPDDVEDDAAPDEGWPRKYHHVVYRAHYEDRCEGDHKVTAGYYPDGCLLDPRRLPWRELRAEMANPRHNFAVIYQQEDADRENVLVDPLWVQGGTDPKTGVVFPGCQDRDRDEWELPQGLAGDIVVYATVDPSPTKWWSIQCWAARCQDGVPHERYLIAHERRYLDAPGFLDWDQRRQCFTGVMEDWQARSVVFGHPIGSWIVERNGAQRFLLQYDHVQRWLAHWRVDLIPHDTYKNRSDPDFGVQMLAGIYRHGLVRLPWRYHTQGKLGSMKLVEEVTHHPQWKTEDCVMAQWFGEFRLPVLVPKAADLPRMPRPSWLKRARTYDWSDQWKRVARVG